MILTVGNHKGGVGKTTTVVTLAHLLHEAGEPVAVVDFDAPSSDREVGAAQAYRLAQGLGIPAYTLDDIPDELDGWVLVDGPPDASDPAFARAVDTADLVLVPTSLHSAELEVSRVYVEEFAREHRVVVLFVRVPYYHRARAQAEAEAWRAAGLDVLDATIPTLQAFDDARTAGTTVADGRRVAWREAKRAYARVLDEIRRRDHYADEEAE